MFHYIFHRLRKCRKKLGSPDSFSREKTFKNYFPFEMLRNMELHFSNFGKIKISRFFLNFHRIYRKLHWSFLYKKIYRSPNSFLRYFQKCVPKMMNLTWFCNKNKISWILQNTFPWYTFIKNNFIIEFSLAFWGIFFIISKVHA